MEQKLERNIDIEKDVLVIQFRPKDCNPPTVDREITLVPFQAVNHRHLSLRTTPFIEAMFREGKN